MQDATYFRRRAAQCRRLAHLLKDQTDPIVLVLLNTASEYDATADALEMRAAREAAYLLRDEVAPQLH